MKTKELIKKVNVVKGIAACEETHRLTFYEIGQTFPFYTMDKKNVDFGQGDSNFRNLSDTNMSRLSYVIDAIREHLETPLAEREEEKRYWLQKIPVPLLDKGTEKKWLWKYTGTKPFNIFGVDITKTDRSTYQTIFTESEIAQMDITGFRKVEVSE